MATLLRPGEWQGAAAQDSIELQFDRLRPGDDCLDDVRRENDMPAFTGPVNAGMSFLT